MLDVVTDKLGGPFLHPRFRDFLWIKFKTRHKNFEELSAVMKSRT